MNSKDLQNILQTISIPNKEEFDTLYHAIITNIFKKIIDGDEDLLISDYVYTLEALNEYTDDMISSEDVNKLSEALRLMQKEIIRLRCKIE
jgi:hypothetical protein